MENKNKAIWQLPEEGKDRALGVAIGGHSCLGISHSEPPLSSSSKQREGISKRNNETHRGKEEYQDQRNRNKK